MNSHKKVNILLFTLVVTFIFSCSVSKKNKQTSQTPIYNFDTLVVNGFNEEPEYRASNKIENDIIHTSLNVKFDWKKSQLIGEAILTCKPYFYSTKQIKLNAVSFEIFQVALVINKEKKPLKYTYDDKILTIELDKEYTRNEAYTLFIDYKAKPEEIATKGSAAITSDKGLYFINPLQAEKNKPTQVWTQGETQASSCWFPTIDSPNERMTQEIFITVDKKYTTLSNGALETQFENGDGTRTDQWKMDKPHAPYLAMMAVGEFAVVRDKWRELEVNYLVEPQYAKYANQIFGNTPEMIEFYSKKLGVDFPWQKYSQVVVRDYVSGAMENTTATLHGEYLQQTDRELLDETNEDVISHELFHQWFGDYVTCESWSNLPLNESFATYGEFLWNEYKYGADEADYKQHESMLGYLARGGANPENLIRFNYKDKEDMFDSHSYNKGGRVLHMLRKQVGDDAFFESLKLYLNTNKFKSVEIHNLRLAFEEVTGEDLNWFFNQWFLSAGHPEFEINYAYIDSTKKQKVTIAQKQNFAKAPLFKVHTKIDIYAGGKKTTHAIFIDKAEQEFLFDCSTAPQLVNFDAEKMLLCTKVENKTAENYLFQIEKAPHYLDRLEALEFAIKNQKNPNCKDILNKALNDKHWAIREEAVRGIKKDFAQQNESMLEPKLMQLAAKDKRSYVRASAVKALGEFYSGDDVLEIIKAATNDKSYSVAAQALETLNKKDSNLAYDFAKTFEKDSSFAIISSLCDIYALNGTESDNAYFLNQLEKQTGFYRYSILQNYSKFILGKNDSVIDNALPIYETAAKTEREWWMRLSAYNTLTQVRDMYDERIKTSQSQMDNLAKISGREKEVEELTAINAKSKLSKEKLDKIIQAVIAQENDKNLKQFYEGKGGI